MTTMPTRRLGGLEVGAVGLGEMPMSLAGRPDEGRHIHRRVSWGALFGGVVLALALQLILSLLGAGIGFGTVNVAAGSTPSASSFGIGAGIWWVVSSTAVPRSRRAASVAQKRRRASTSSPTSCRPAAALPASRRSRTAALREVEAAELVGDHGVRGA